ncbi:MAG: N5-carboxyaminoimidazole ribonucleotide mutase [Candidatus Parcubacteria bacterium]|jgi:5-(carboxyamino)imidazole ribonucleotide mutase
MLEFSMKQQPHIAIIMGSDSDLPVMSEAAAFLDTLGIHYELTIVSAHRTPERLREYALSAHERGLKVIIAGAGGAAHLPGMTAAFSPLPVIGVPIQSKTLSGVDSLHSIVQMPPGVPVATVAINGAKNAAILACQMLGIADSEIHNKVVAFRKQQERLVLQKAEELEHKGYDAYLKQS